MKTDLELIRDACVRAQPEIVEREALWCPRHGFLEGKVAVSHLTRNDCREKCEDHQELRPIRLADVLWMLKSIGEGKIACWTVCEDLWDRRSLPAIRTYITLPG